MKSNLFLKIATALILLSIIIYFLSGLVQPPHLYKIIQNEKVGYINAKGKIVILPIYLDGNDFSEGLAAVRIGGLYGFINTKGNVVINPTYDYATSFTNGVARVFREDKPIFINKHNDLVIDTAYKMLSFIDDRKAFVTTLAGRQGVIDVPTKKLLIDTIYGTISPFENGVAVVEDYGPPEDRRRTKNYAVIATNGNIIVPFDKYETINLFSDGVAIVNFKDTTGQHVQGAIDTSGHLLFKISSSNHDYMTSDFNEGFAKMGLHRPKNDSYNYYEGFINKKGEVVLNDTTYENAYTFSNGRAFVKQQKGDYILIDKHFKRIGKNSFKEIIGNSFTDGYAIVEKNGAFGVIDTTGNYVVKPQFKNVDYTGIVNGYFFFSADTNNAIHYGIADVHGNVIVRPIIDVFDYSGFINGLMQVVIDDRLHYIDQKGKIIWAQPKENITALYPLDIAVMNRGYFYAYAAAEDMYGFDRYAGRGWARSTNIPNTLQFPDNTLSVKINTSKTDTFQTRYKGYELTVSNTTIDTMRFHAQDGRLYLKIQARDKNGEWRDIEYLSGSWCGNSYHKIELLPGYYWRFTIPDYHGVFKTKIRASLEVIDKLHPKDDIIIYSNIIDGSVNPGQFWNKRAYYPTNIMDPYNE